MCRYGELCIDGRLFGMVYRSLIFSFLASFLMVCNVDAGYLRLENEDDLDRVSGNVLYFIIHEKEVLNSLNEEKDFEPEKCIKIIKGSSDLMYHFRKNPKDFLKDLSGLINYTINNKTILQSNVSFPYDEFTNGLWYLKNIFSKETINTLRSK